jgi:hypothetical protein
MTNHKIAMGIVAELLNPLTQRSGAGRSSNLANKQVKPVNRAANVKRRVSRFGGRAEWRRMSGGRRSVRRRGVAGAEVHQRAQGGHGDGARPRYGDGRRASYHD